MFKNIKLLRKLKKDSYEIEYSQEGKINRENEAVVSIKSKDESEIISKFSTEKDLTITPELSSYLKESADDIPVKNPIKIEINTPKDLEIEKQKKVKLALRNHFTKKVSDINEKLDENEVECYILVLLSIVFLLAYVLVKIHMPIEILSEILLIVAWVFVWRMTESIVFVRKEMRREAVKYYRLLTAKIEFKTKEK